MGEFDFNFIDMYRLIIFVVFNFCLEYGFLFIWIIYIMMKYEYKYLILYLGNIVKDDFIFLLMNVFVNSMG